LKKLTFVQSLEQPYVRFGSLADKPSPAKMRRCPLLPESDRHSFEFLAARSGRAVLAILDSVSGDLSSSLLPRGSVTRCAFKRATNDPVNFL
jgi:hypothetical protein